MKLFELISILEPWIPPQKEVQLLSEVFQVTADSREAGDGAIFVAIKGTQFDAHQLLPEVCSKKVLCVVVEERAVVPGDYQGVVLRVPNTRKALALLSHRFFGQPSAEMFVFGVTGTNGKTSCTYLMEHLLNSLALPTGVIGTIEHRLGEKRWPTSTTTPGSIELQERLSQMRSAGARAIAIEVSSHALDQYRVDGVAFNSVLFTNLTQDHLDYHKTMQNYFAAKQRLFSDLLWEGPKPAQVAAVNTDDFWGRQLRVAFPAEIFSYGQKLGADFRYDILDMSFQEIDYQVQTPFGRFNGTVPLCGPHSLANVIGTMAAATAVGVAPPIAVKSFSQFAGVPGRLQSVPNQKNRAVFVDYAHSPDALENVLKALKGVRNQSQSVGKIHVVFGCGGDRDKGKRPLMGAIAEREADRVIVTSDNPRTEDPLAIIEDIRKGFKKPDEALFIADRKEAIAVALGGARDGDAILIAGKGHEDYQIVGAEKFHFSDFEIAQGFLS